MSKENKTKKIFRVEKDKNYSVIHNPIFLDKRISWGAKGVLGYALTKPDDWDLYISEVTKNGSDKIDKVTKYFKELRLSGYIEYVITRERGKITKTEYLVYEKPLHTNPINMITRHQIRKEKKLNQEKPDLESPRQEKPRMEKPFVENTPLVNTDYILNTDNNKVLTISTQLKEFAKQNNLVYEMNVREDQKAQSKFVTELSQTNEQILAQVERLKPILKDSSCDWWSKTNSFGFNFLLKNWGRIDAWHNANKSNVVKFVQPTEKKAPAKFSDNDLNSLKEFLA